jgi:sigma-B regulation protein RsbU (phosphoserine phosphatase)
VVLVGVPGLLLYGYREVYDPARSEGAMPDWVTLFTGLAVVVGGLALPALHYRRLDNRNERRRLRVLVAGTFIALAGLTPVSMVACFDLPAGVGATLRSPAALAVSSVIFLVLPASFACAVLRHQIFDVKLILRQGLQYALARGLVVSLVPACAVLLVVDLLVHGDQPFGSIVAARGWIYLGAAGIAGAVHVQRRRWLEAIDRRFLRERYDAQRLMLNVMEEILRATGVKSVAPQLVAQIDAALHSEYAALLERGSGIPGGGGGEPGPAGRSACEARRWRLVRGVSPVRDLRRQRRILLRTRRHGADPRSAASPAGSTLPSRPAARPRRHGHGVRGARHGPR